MKSEFEMRRAICIYLSSMGYSPLLECYSVGNCDIVGVRFGIKKIEDVICVELKLKNVAGVLQQLNSHRERSSRTYAAMPQAVASNPKTLARFKATVHGLIGVDGEGIMLVQDSLPRLGWVPSLTFRNAWRRRDVWRNRMNNPKMIRYYHPPQPDPAVWKGTKAGDSPAGVYTKEGEA